MEKTKIDESKKLLKRVCDLPDNEKELKLKGYSEQDIKEINNLLLSFDPEANQEWKRIKDIMDKVDNGKTLYQGYCE